jgi:hypothetical protein
MGCSGSAKHHLRVDALPLTSTSVAVQYATPREAAVDRAPAPAGSTLSRVQYTTTVVPTDANR